MNNLKKHKMSIHETTKFFLKIFEEWNFIRVTDFFYKLNGEITPKSFFKEMELTPSYGRYILNALYRMNIITRRKYSKNMFYKMDKKRFDNLKLNYSHLIKKIAC
jgi:hypothetical protein